MNQINRITTIAAISLIMLLGASCTSFRAWESAQEYEAHGEWDKAVIEYRKVLELDPDNIRYRMALQHASLEASRLHFAKGKELRTAGHPEMAALELRLAYELDPTNQFAAVEYAKAVSDTQRERATESRDIEEMKRRVTEQSRPPLLNPASNEPISLSFPNRNVKDIYLALGNAFGINVMFDQRLADDQISIELRDVTAQQALERVMQSAAHFYKVLDEQTIIVVPDNANTRREYEDLVIRTFYLSNGDAEAVVNVVRSMLEARNVFPLKSLNAITIRDTADKVLIAEQIIEANDKARAEVVVQVELLQVDASKLRNIGLSLSTSTYGFQLNNDGGTQIGSLPINGFGDLTSDNWSVSIPSVSYNLLKNNTEATLLARPQLRISEGEAATLHIGQQVPIAVTTYNSISQNPGQNVFAPPTSYQYRDVGIKITIEPRVHHNREITLKLTVEVSNVQDSVGDQPIIGTRTIESTIRLKDGETNFLAGLIRRDESTTDSKIPFLSDLPLIGRLFSSRDNSDRTTDLVLTMTPHIIRIPDITEEDLAPMWVGTSSNITFRGRTPRMESQNGGNPFQPENNQFVHQTPDLFPVNPGGADPTYQTDQVGEPIIPPADQPNVPRPSSPTDQRPQEQPVSIPPQPQNSSKSSPAADPIPAPIIVKKAESDSGTEVSAPTPAVSQSAAVRMADAEPTGQRARPSRPFAAPRISVQPYQLDLEAGQEAHWLVVGIDIDGLETNSIVLTYDSQSIDVTGVVPGSAIRTSNGLEALTVIDPEAGLITIQSADGNPLRFETGGEILRIGIRGVLEGSSTLSVNGLKLHNLDGEIVETVITGGFAEVSY